MDGLAETLYEVRVRFPEYAHLSDEEIIFAITGIPPLIAVFSYHRVEWY